MRVLMVTSFPIPGDYDGTTMLPIKILRAMRPRGVDVVVAYLRARPPWETVHPPDRVRGDPGLRGPGLGLGQRPGVEADRARPAVRPRSRAALWRRDARLHRLSSLRLADGLRDPLAARRRGRARSPGPGDGLPDLPSPGETRGSPRGGSHRPGRAGQTGGRRGEGRPGRSGPR